MPNPIDITGLRFGRLTAVRLLGSENKRRIWLTRCACGAEISAMLGNLIRGNTKSCGCLKIEMATARLPHPVKHGHSTKQVKRRSPTYRSWLAMKARCLNPKNKRFADYGGRGIAVCKRWLVFENFLADMGERPAGMTLDRIDNDIGYEKTNCRWADSQTQSTNKRVKGPK
jgi:hypothetical protein